MGDARHAEYGTVRILAISAARHRPNKIANPAVARPCAAGKCRTRQSRVASSAHRRPAFRARKKISAQCSLSWVRVSIARQRTQIISLIET